MKNSLKEVEHNLIKLFKPEGATHYWMHLADNAIDKLSDRERIIPFVLVYWRVDENDLTYVWVEDKKEWVGGDRKSSESWFGDAIPLD